MPTPKCLAEINRAVGRELTDDEADDLFTELRRRQQRRRRERANESAEESFLNAAGEIADEKVAAAIIAKRNAALNLRRKLEALDYVRTQFPDAPALGLEALMTGVNRKRTGARFSADAEQRQLAGHYAQGFIADVERSGLWNIFVSGELDDEIARALWQLDRKAPNFEGISNNAQTLGEAVHKWQEIARHDANRSGAWIKKLPGYIARQSHDTFKIRTVSFEEWRDFIVERLDERTFDNLLGDTTPEKFLRSVYDGLASGVHFANPADGAPNAFKGANNVARDMSADRLLHFKDANAWSAYNKRFGVGSFREAVLFGLERTAKNTGLMRVWGPNARQNFDDLFQSLLKDARRAAPQRAADLQNDLSWLENRFDEIDGSVNIPGNVMFSKWAAIIRAIQSMAKLGGAVLSAIADIPIAASELRFQGVGFLESHLIPLSAIAKGRGTRQQREILGMIGVTMDGMRGAVLHRFSGHDDLPGAMSKWMRTFFKWNGLTWWTDAMRASVGYAMSSRLAARRNASWASLDDDLKRSLEAFGLDSGKWDLLRRTDVKRAEGTAFMVPEQAREIGDEAAKAYLTGKGFKGSGPQVRRLKEEIESQLRSYFVDRVEFAVIQPDARTQSILRQGTRPGTVNGELMRFVTQFKSFPTAVLTKSVGRELYGRGADSLGQALRSGNGEMRGLVNLIIGTTVFGYLAGAAKDLAKGRTPRDPNSFKTWFAAMAQGGGAGIYGDFLFGEVRNRFGGSVLDTLAGPTAGAFSDIVDLYGRVRDGDDPSAAALSTFINNAPGANLFYTRAALDYLVLYQLREAMSPGYLRRLEKRLEKENAQTFLIKPSSAIPTGGGSRLFEGVR